MSHEKEMLTPEQSLHVITSMIRQAKGNMRQSSFYYLLWGWTITIANLGVYVMIKFTDVGNPFLMFIITIPAAIISVIYGARQEKSIIAPTPFDTISKWMWISFGINCFVMAIFGAKTNWQINPIIITMCAAPTFISGTMLKFKPLQAGGITFWIIGIASFMVGSATQFLLAAIAVTLGYLVPGYLLKRSEE
jgi:hypothetical protein